MAKHELLVPLIGALLRVCPMAVKEALFTQFLKSHP